MLFTFPLSVTAAGAGQLPCGKQAGCRDCAALAVRGGVTGAFVVREGRAVFTWLRLGRETLAQCSKGAAAEPVLEVLAGLRGDELLVDRPNDRLADGDPVTITSPRSAEKMQNAEAMK